MVRSHVGAGISVRHGEDVQLVYELPVLFKGGAGAEDDISEHRRINKFSQEGQPPGLILFLFQSMSMVST